MGLYDVSFVGSRGSKLYVSTDLPSIDVSGMTDDEKYAAVYDAFAGLDEDDKFVEIDNITDGGSLGGEDEIGSETKLRDGKPQKWKGASDPGSQAITLGLAIEDAGQRIVRNLARQRPGMGAFKAELPDGRTAYYAAIVSGVPTNIGTASDYLSASFNLAIVDDIYWSDIREDMV